MGTLSYESEHSKYIFIASCREGADEAKKAGLRPAVNKSLQWETRSHNKARTLRRYANASAELKLKRTFITKHEAPECIIYKDELSPKWWQIESAWHLTTRSPSLLADEAGLGKSATSILAINSVPGKALIICPPYLKWNWYDEVRQWLCSPKLKGGCAVIGDKRTASDFNQDIIILPDSLLQRPWAMALLKKAAPFQWLIVDEWHRFKTESAKRTQALVGGMNGHQAIADMAERIALLSGTPLPNGKPIELYPTLSKLSAEAVGHRSFEDFGRTFCAGKRVTRHEGKSAFTAWDFSGASQLEKLREELNAKAMVRHEKKDCLKDLPPKQRRLIFLDTPSHVLRLEKGALKKLSFEELNLSTLGDVAEYRRQVGMAKINGAVEYITDILQSDPHQKLVVAAYHVNVVEQLCERLETFNPLRIRGGMDAQEKQRRVNAFQKLKAHRVVIGNYVAMGLGLTLTAATRGVFVEPDWTPGVNEQMEDRIHRIGQNQSVLWDYLILRGSLDERMLHQALSKESNITTVMKGKNDL